MQSVGGPAAARANGRAVPRCPGAWPAGLIVSASVASPQTATRKSRLPPRAAWYNPRIWMGCSTPALVRLLSAYGWRASPRDWPITAFDLALSCYNSVLGGVERLVFGRAVARTEIRHAPLFILGHWRTGTTLLHELLVQDARHTCPNNYHCVSPNHFLLSEWVATRLFGFMLPKQRAMDSMPLGWDRPQEDDFALVNLGLASPYAAIAFPNEPRPLRYGFDLDELSAAEVARWKEGFLWFLKRITWRTPKRIILKSPPHTFRVRTLLELFPDARFVHIVRDPYVVFSSTLHLWKSVYLTQALQPPSFDGLEEFVFDTYARMYQRLEATRGLVPADRFHELRYEDLVAAPLVEMRKLYERLELGDFDAVLPALERYLEGVKGYRTNRYELEPELEAEITRRWAEPIRRWGYERTAAEARGQ